MWIGLKGPRPDRWTMGTLNKMAKSPRLPHSEPTVLAFLRSAVSLSKVTDQPGADYSLDAYADTEAGARLICQRAGQQLRQIVSLRRSA
jgi:hypothetical protein